jgi:hypothetical protein
MKKLMLILVLIIIAMLNLTAVSAQDDPGIETEFLFDLHLEIEEPLQIVGAPYGGRRIFTITGGTVEGPQVSGEVLSGGADWGLDRADGVSELDARLTIRTVDDEIITMSYTGIIYNSPDGDLYWRMQPRFETGEAYAWLTRLVAVGVFEDFGGSYVEYKLYLIK